MNLQKNILLKNYSNYKIGGPARLFVQVNSVDELKEVISTNRNEKIFILAGGTKILINDEGFNGLVIFNKIGGILRQRFGQVENVVVGSGVLTKDLLEYCIENSLSGLEWAGGLPGTIGGAVRGNAGSFESETKNNVVKVKSLILKTLNEKIRNNSECQFAYRDSIFKSGEASSEFIAQVTLKLTLGDKEKIKEKIRERIDYRNNHQPMNYPSIGSTFKNIPLNSLSGKLQKEFASLVKTDPFPVVQTTKLLALCGLKGRRVGNAMISDKHPNFIVNLGNATSKDVKALIEIAKQTVKGKYKILLEEEIIYLN